MDPVEVRRQNLLAPFSAPHTTPIGQTYDVGDYDGALDRRARRRRLCRAADGAAAPARRRRPDAAGHRRELYVEITGGVPPFGDDARIDVTDDGHATVFTGNLAARPRTRHRVGDDRVRAHRHPDGSRHRWSGATPTSSPSAAARSGSRSLAAGRAPQCKAAHRAGRRAPARSPRSCSRRRRRRRARQGRRRLPRDRHAGGGDDVGRAGCGRRQRRGDRSTSRRRFVAAGPTFPFGAHVAVVEVDVETGQVRLVRHVACDDAGRMLNPLLFEGQMHGGDRPGRGAGADRGGPLRLGRQPDHREPRRLHDHLAPPSCPTSRSCTWRRRRRQPARRQRHRRVGHDRLDTGGAVGGGRRPRAPRRSPPRHARHARARLAGDPGLDRVRRPLTARYVRPVKLSGLELRRIAMPLRTPFRTSFGTQVERDVLLVRAEGTVGGSDAIGWGECVALSEPVYSPEYVDGAAHVIEHFLAPRLFAAGDVAADDVARSARRCSRDTRWPRRRWRWRSSTLSCGRRASRSAAASARWPSGCRRAFRSGSPTRSRNCSTRSPGYLDDGYIRIKLKIEPGIDVERVAAVRERFGDDLMLQVDANAAYTLDDADHLAELDAFDLLLIEQPLSTDDLRAATRCWRSGCARRSASTSRSPRRRARPMRSRSGRARSSTSRPAGSAATSRRSGSTTCATRTGCPCGAAACSRPGSAAPPTSRWPRCPASRSPATRRLPTATGPRDLTEPFVLGDDGHIAVPTGPGLGVEPLPDVLAQTTTSSRWVRA